MASDDWALTSCTAQHLQWIWLHHVGMPRALHVLPREEMQAPVGDLLHRPSRNSGVSTTSMVVWALLEREILVPVSQNIDC